MCNYITIRNLLFKLPPEVAHTLTLNLLRIAALVGWRQRFPEHSISMLGLEFTQRVGLAAGLDKNGDYIDALGSLGFGAIEIGTVTPRPQVGNAKPRLFRLPGVRAIINRMGFNNKGVDHCVRQLKRAALRRRGFKGIIGVNIGKNFDTPLDRAVDDYLLCFEKVYPYASYVTVNLSSPNTAGLRELQHGDYLRELILRLTSVRSDLKARYSRYVPIVYKIAPDLSDEELQDIAEVLLELRVDGVIATNTTITRPRVGGEDGSDIDPVGGGGAGNGSCSSKSIRSESSGGQASAETKLLAEQGGLSGAPLLDLSVGVVRRLHALLGDEIPIIGVGGIQSHEDAEKFFSAGAQFVQIYTGLIYQGPGLVKDIAS